jgi:predicted transcriptional regulator
MGMSVTEINAVMQQYGITEKHIARHTGLDYRTVRKYLASGQGHFSTATAVETALRQIVQERSEIQVSPKTGHRSTA